MPIEFAYQVVKDVIALAKMKKADPIDPGTNDANALVAVGIVDDGSGYSWSRQGSLFARTEVPNASHEIVWVTDELRRTKRKVVRFAGDGALDLILIRKRSS